MKKQTYGWFIIAFGVLILGISYGVLVNGLSIFIKPITSDLGFLRSRFAVCQSLVNIAIMLSSLISGRLYQKVRPILIMKIAAILLPAAYFLMSQCSRLWQFYILFFIMGSCVAFLTILPFPIIITNWFTEKKGLAVGICFMGTGIGGMIFNWIGGLVLASFSWRIFASFVPLAMLLIIAPPVYFFIKETPEEKGYCREVAAATSPLANTTSLEGVSRQEALRTPELWLMILSASLLGYTTATQSFTVVTHVSDVGFSAVYAAGLTSICYGAIALGKVVVGWLFDHVGLKKACVFASAAILLGVFGLFFAQHKFCHGLIAYGNFFGSPVATVAYPCLAQYIFGKKAYVEINGYLNSANFLGVAIAPYVANLFYDSKGTYNGAFLVAAAMVLIIVLFFLWVKPVYKPSSQS